jgi:uncharacterized membrane protein
MLTNEWLYCLIGTFLIGIAVHILNNRENPKRLAGAAFWGLLGLSFGYGTFVESGRAPAWILGVAVLVMVALAGFGLTARSPERTTSPKERAAGAVRFGNKLFVPALLVPVVTVLVATVGPLITIGGTPLLADGSATLTGLGIGSIVASVVAVLMLRPPSLGTPLHESGRLLEAIGWAALLPQMLSTLGILFTQAGVDTAVGTIARAVLPAGSLFAAVVVYAVGMAAFTVIMGNAFAAFPIMTAAVGWPVLVQTFGGNAAAIFAIGMLSGYSGTLATPMAANFNLVPAALLEMKDRYGPIKAQLPTAGLLLLVDVGVMYFAAF